MYERPAPSETTRRTLRRICHIPCSVSSTDGGTREASSFAGFSASALVGNGLLQTGAVEQSKIDTGTFEQPCKCDTRQADTLARPLASRRGQLGTLSANITPGSWMQPEQRDCNPQWPPGQLKMTGAEPKRSIHAIRPADSPLTRNPGHSALTKHTVLRGKHQRLTRMQGACGHGRSRSHRGRPGTRKVG